MELFHLCGALQQGTAVTLDAPPIGKMIAPGKVLVIAREKEWFSVNQRKIFAWGQVETDLKLNADSLQKLREILKYRALQFPLNYRGPKTLLPHLAKFKQAAEWLSASAACNMHSGHLDAAVDDVESVALLCRPLDTEPFLISQLVRVAVSSIAFNLCHEMIECEGINDRHLVRLHHICDELQFVDPMILGLKGDRTMYRDSIRDARSTGVDLAALLANYAPGDSQADSFAFCGTPYHDDIYGAIRSAIILPCWRSLFSYRDERHALEEVQTLLDNFHSAKFHRSMLTMDRFENALENKSGSDGAFRSWDYWLTGMFMRALGKAHVRAFRAETQRGMTIAAIALKRYHLAHGKYPSRLDELIPDFVREVPVDWRDGQNLRYRQERDTFVLWSVGDNGKDDGGTPDQTDPYSFFSGLDLVWPQPATEDELNAYRAKVKPKP
ncbi:MAG TPA: hypothetical protein VK615_16905 [Candidatus Binatia bacterium]|nr:hypothetical protein [Candidatus Binatia bacterium]